MSKQMLRNIAGYFLQLEERAVADCYPNLQSFARRQSSRYLKQLRDLRG
ncbi:hypothetical protein SAMN05216312_102190 [Cohnella sp. OV330]|nr:hypothetical protein [Cohnella sp. OV330]SFA91133.1 hypothetical protein SAMN05216312_102190 [Cohnella sp. OV330]